MRAATDGRLLCRINGYGPWTAGEVDDAIARGADEILLPMVRTTEEVDRTLDLVAGRVRARHPDRDAGRRRPRRPRSPAGRCRASTSGSTTCASTAAPTELFRPLVDGTVDAVRAEVAQPFGVGGLTLPGCGFPGAQRPAGRRARPPRTPTSPSCAGRSPPTWPAATRSPRCRGCSASLAALRRADAAEAAAATGRRFRGGRPAPRPALRWSGGAAGVRALVTGAGGFVGRHLVAPADRPTAGTSCR